MVLTKKAPKINVNVKVLHGTSQSCPLNFFSFFIKKRRMEKKRKHFFSIPKCMWSHHVWEPDMSPSHPILWGVDPTSWGMRIGWIRLYSYATEPTFLKCVELHAPLSCDDDSDSHKALPFTPEIFLLDKERCLPFQE